MSYPSSRSSHRRSILIHGAYHQFQHQLCFLPAQAIITLTDVPSHADVLSTAGFEALVCTVRVHSRHPDVPSSPEEFERIIISGGLAGMAAVISRVNIRNDATQLTHHVINPLIVEPDTYFLHGNRNKLLRTMLGLQVDYCSADLRLAGHGLQRDDKAQGRPKRESNPIAHTMEGSKEHTTNPTGSSLLISYQGTRRITIIHTTYPYECGPTSGKGPRNASLVPPGSMPAASDHNTTGRFSESRVSSCSGGCSV